MEKVSVIMSAYNENENEFLLALNSIRNQTYSNIEIIIVIDNPNRIDLVRLIECVNDSRIFTVKNEKNIGLANSMNLAAHIAKGKYLARMDADDIAYPDRLQKELEQLKKTHADYVCSWYEYIDENGKKLNRKTKFYKNEVINEMLPYTNCIHHPTVVIKKDVFFQVGGYRNFPCAQDYDLWLRLYDHGYHLAIIEEPLLLYRIRQESITNRKGYQQFYTAEYIRKLLKERQKKGKDSFNEENYYNYLNSKGAFDIDKINRWAAAKEKRQKKGRWYYILLVFESSVHRKILMNAIRCIYIEMKLQLKERCKREVVRLK